MGPRATESPVQLVSKSAFEAYFPRQRCQAHPSQTSVPRHRVYGIGGDHCSGRCPRRDGVHSHYEAALFELGLCDSHRLPDHVGHLELLGACRDHYDTASSPPIAVPASGV